MPVTSFLHSRESPWEGVDKVTKAVMPYRTPIGIGGIVVAVVHFLLPALTIL